MSLRHLGCFVLMGALCSTAAYAGVPANDSCAGAIPLATGVPTAWDNTLATTDGPAMCGSGTPLDVWFTYTAPGPGTVVFDCALPISGVAQTDTRMQLFLAPFACPPVLPALECDDDDGVGFASLIRRSVVGGEVFLIQLAGWGTPGAVAAGQILVDYVANGEPISNNACATAIPLATGVAQNFCTLGATGLVADSPLPGCGATGTPRDIWYSWTSPASAGFAEVSLCASHPAFNTRVAVYGGGGLCPAVAPPIICDDNACTPNARAAWLFAPSTTYLIQVSVSSGITGSATGDNAIGNIVVGIVPPPGDECAGAITLAFNTLTSFDTSLGYTLSAPAFTCGSAAPDIWYSFTPPCDQTYRISTCGSAGLFGDTVLHVYDECGGLLEACVDDSFFPGCAGFEAVLDLALTGGEDYFIRASGWSGSTGSGQIIVTAPSVPDTCATAGVAVDGVNTFDTCATAAGTDGPAACATISRDVWATYTATCNGNLVIDTGGSTVADTVLVVYNGAAPCPVLATDQVACNDDAIGLLSQVTILGVTIGQTFRIRAGSFGATGTTGLLNVNIDCQGVDTPTNIACSVVTPGLGDVSVTWDDAELYDFVNVYVDTLLVGTVPSTGGANSTTVSVSTFAAHTICVEGQIGAETSGQACCTISVPGDGTGLEIIVDGDGAGAIDSATALNASLIANGLSPIVVPTLASFVGTPARLWVLNGTFGGGNHVLSAAEGTQLSNIVIGGGHVYVEGGDTFGFDPATPFDDYNGLDDAMLADGNDTFNAMTGADFSAATYSGLSALYNQDITVGNDWTDQYVASALDLAGPQTGVVWSNDPMGAVGETAYATGVYYNTNAGFGKVQVQSWEFGGYGGDQTALGAAYIAALMGTPPPAAVSGLTCTLGAGGADVSWTNNGTYDEIRVYVDGVLSQTLGGGATTAFVATLVDALICIEPYTLRGGAGAQVCCNYVAQTDFVRGDANGDGGFDIADAIFTLSELFAAGAPSQCDDATDSNDDGNKDIGDAVYTLSALFTFGSPLPPAPHPLCGIDPTADSLDCDTYVPCP